MSRSNYTDKENRLIIGFFAVGSVPSKD